MVRSCDLNFEANVPSYDLTNVRIHNYIGSYMRAYAGCATGTNPLASFPGSAPQLL